MRNRTEEMKEVGGRGYFQMAALEVRLQWFGKAQDPEFLAGEVPVVAATDVPSTRWACVLLPPPFHYNVRYSQLGPEAIRREGEEAAR